MNRERARELLPIIQAFAEGKAIEYKTYSEKWVPLPDPPAFYGDSEYRIKPEPREFWIWWMGNHLWEGSDKQEDSEVYIDVIHVREVLDDE